MDKIGSGSNVVGRAASVVSGGLSKSLVHRRNQDHQAMETTKSSVVKSGQQKKESVVHTDHRETLQRASILHKPTGINKTNKTKKKKLVADLMTDPLRWFRDEQLSNQFAIPTINPVSKLQSSSTRPQSDWTDSKLLTIGGYIISLEKDIKKLTAMIRPTISSSSTSSLELEVRISNCDPGAIRVERRYNAILVIGVIMEETTDPEDPQPMEGELMEVVNIFVPRDVNLAKISVSEAAADPKGRIFIKAPY